MTDLLALLLVFSVAAVGGIAGGSLVAWRLTRAVTRGLAAALCDMDEALTNEALNVDAGRGAEDTRPADRHYEGDTDA